VFDAVVAPGVLAAAPMRNEYSLSALFKHGQATGARRETRHARTPPEARSHGAH